MNCLFLSHSLYQRKAVKIAMWWIIFAIPLIYFICEAKQEKVTTDCE
jgi:MFS-type transporter involved in bile tolerance (Atg22 family)